MPQETDIQLITDLNTLANPDLGKYAELVQHCAINRLDYQISNGSAAHARILIEQLFRFSKEEVQIVSGSLREISRKENIELYSYPPLIEQAKRFLHRQLSKLTIVIANGQLSGNDDNALLDALNNDKDRKGAVKVLIPEPNLLESVKVPHFMVSDQSAFRFETARDADPDAGSVKAIANFGTPHEAKTLSNYFEKLVSRLESSPTRVRQLVFAAR